MEVRTLPGAASALSSELPRLTTAVVEQLNDPSLLSDPSVESSIELILDRLCLSVQLSKPVGLATWAIREGRRWGVTRTMELAETATHVIVSEASVRFLIDQRRLLAFLDVLKSEIRSALAALGGEPADAKLPRSEPTNALLAMLAERDMRTCSHAQATAEWTRRLCESMGLDRETASFIELCSLLHDIGMAGTPESILLKPGELTAEERDVMREHAAAGARILNQVPSLARCSAVVRAHHERWDGTGYPDGLAGDAIPFEARVIAVADAFHAMISDRPYRAAIPPRRALDILQAGRGTQWDPLIVDAILSLFSGSRKPRSNASHASTA
jgi:putative nucleotidyltransferase with HDIG domain